MPVTPRETLLCHYHYDPLDRQARCTPNEKAGIQRFYCKTRLATETQGAVQCSIFQHDDQLLAQQQCQSGKLDTTLLATDQQRSVLNVLANTRPHPLAYTPYGHCPPENGLLSLLGFNGERPDPVTGHYHLGNGYRQFNPVLMRFNSPDSMSPFGKGGINAYAYCEGDPRNRVDPTGHFFKSLGVALGLKRSLSTPKAKEMVYKVYNYEDGVIIDKTPIKASTTAYTSTTLDLSQYNTRALSKITLEYDQFLKKKIESLTNTISRDIARPLQDNLYIVPRLRPLLNHWSKEASTVFTEANKHLESKITPDRKSTITHLRLTIFHEQQVRQKLLDEMSSIRRTIKAQIRR